jgi:hypothetical protein
MMATSGRQVINFAVEKADNQNHHRTVTPVGAGAR